MGRKRELDRLQRVTVRSRAQWRQWLKQNHATTESIWLVTFKKDSNGPYVAYEDIVEEALCFGWIDSLTKRLDEDRTMRLISPRRPKSVWSKPNQERVARLIAGGLMRAPGLKMVERAKQDGSWNALAEVDTSVIPKELKAEFARRPEMEARFTSLSESLRRRMLQHLGGAKGEATKRKRVEWILAQCAGGGRKGPVASSESCITEP